MSVNTWQTINTWVGGGGITLAVDASIDSPVFSVQSSVTLPVANINFNISKPIFSIMATVTGLDIIVGSNAKLTVNFESNKLTLKTQSNYLKV